ncbi:MAG: DUF5667 domain-containing protein [bacterium]
MSRLLVRQLNKAKSLKEFGALSLEDKDRVRQDLFTRISAEAELQPSVGFSNTWSGFVDVFRFWSAVKPLAYAGSFAALFVLAFIGLVSAYDSVPGDSLYRLKIVSERAQLKLASTDEAKVRLHLEFASRRAEEVGRMLEAFALNKTSTQTANVKQTVGNLKQELNAVSSQLNNLHQSKDTQAAKVAQIVDRKVSDLEKTFDANFLQMPEDVQTEVDAAKGVAEIASVQAFQVLVEKAKTDVAMEDALVKKVSDRFASLKVDQNTLENAVAEQLGAIAARGGSLAILAPADLEKVTALKQYQADLSATAALIEEGEGLLAEKDIGVAMEKSNQAAKSLLEVSLALKGLALVEQPKEEAQTSAVDNEPSSESAESDKL